MNIVDKALETQIRNLQERCGKSLEELFAFLRGSGLEKHGELRDLLKRELGMGHGDANTLVHLFRQQTDGGGTQATPGAGAAAERGTGKAAASNAGTTAATPAGFELDTIYAGKKESLRPIHEAFMERLASFGDFEIAPKKAYVSLRRKKQFAMIGPATNTRVEIGLNMKGIEATDRLVANPPGGMCQYTVRITEVSEVNEELMGWVRFAYESAG